MVRGQRLTLIRPALLPLRPSLIPTTSLTSSFPFTSGGPPVLSLGGPSPRLRRCCCKVAHASVPSAIVASWWHQRRRKSGFRPHMLWPRDYASLAELGKMTEVGFQTCRLPLFPMARAFVSVSVWVSEQDAWLR